MKMKLFISDMQKNKGAPSSKSGGGAGGSSSGTKKPTFFSSMSKTLGKLNPFRHGSKDTSNIEDAADAPKPRRRRFSIS
ncbi:hypothetical protein MLD38_008546 [Melastoma candidum]|nr:hypothetical protein MLD38_008546 [Melastoma candidum]